MSHKKETYTFVEDMQMIQEKVDNNNEKYRNYEVCGDKSNLPKSRNIENTIGDWKDAIERQRRKKAGLPYGEFVGGKGYY